MKASDYENRSERIADIFWQLPHEQQKSCMRRLKVINAIADSKTLLYMQIRDVIVAAAATKRSGRGEAKKLEDIEDEALFEWALGYYKALLKTADEYEREHSSL